MGRGRKGAVMSLRGSGFRREGGMSISRNVGWRYVYAISGRHVGAYMDCAFRMVKVVGDGRMKLELERQVGLLRTYLQTVLV
jgi:hypothetical protein